MRLNVFWSGQGKKCSLSGRKWGSFSCSWTGQKFAESSWLRMRWDTAHTRLGLIGTAKFTCIAATYMLTTGSYSTAVIRRTNESVRINFHFSRSTIHSIESGGNDNVIYIGGIQLTPRLIGIRMFIHRMPANRSDCCNCRSRRRRSRWDTP